MSSKKHVSLQLTKLKGNYNTLFNEDHAEWLRRVDAHHEKLRKIDAIDVEAACEEAPLRYPDKFPNVGQLANLAAECARNRKKEARRLAAEEREEVENKIILERTDETRRRIPNDPIGMERWVAQGSSDAERLARYFEAQSKQMGLDPTKPAHRDVEHERWRLLRQVLGVEELADVAGDMTREANPPPRPPPRTTEAA